MKCEVIYYECETGEILNINSTQIKEGKYIKKQSKKYFDGINIKWQIGVEKSKNQTAEQQRLF